MTQDIAVTARVLQTLLYLSKYLLIILLAAPLFPQGVTTVDGSVCLNFFLHWIPFLMQPSYFSEIGTSPRSALACGPLSLDLSPPTLKQEIFYV